MPHIKALAALALATLLAACTSAPPEAETPQFNSPTPTAFPALAHADTPGPHTVIDRSGTI